MPFEFFIGRRYLRAKQKEAFIALITWLSVAGVTVGVMALIIVIAVMSGFEDDLKTRILGVESHLVIMRHGGGFKDYKNVLAKVRAADGVLAGTPFIYSQVMLRSGLGLSGAILRGVDPESAGDVIKNLKPQVLKTSASQKGPGIILGKELARKLGLGKGDVVFLISPRGMISPIGHLPVMKRFIVRDFFESGMYEFDGSLAYINYKDAQKILKMGDSVSGIEIRVDDIYNVPKIAEKIVDKLGFPYWTKDWMQMNRNLFSALKLEKTVMFIILVLIVMVAAFNIAGSLIMMVIQKTKDIAILKAMGTTEKSIRKIFVFQGMIIGALGTVLGTFFGVVLCLLLKKYKFIELPPDVYYVTTLPVRLEALDIVLIAVATMAICFLATIYPARRAAKLNPVEALRYG
jgi:lipoprotein-releasing system permease protein